MTTTPEYEPCGSCGEPVEKGAGRHACDPHKCKHPWCENDGTCWGCGLSARDAVKLLKQRQELTDVICTLMGKFVEERLAWAETRRKLEVRIKALEADVAAEHASLMRLADKP